MPPDTAAALQAVLDAHPDLTAFGFGAWDERRLTPQERAARIAQGRADLFADPEPFTRARSWLAGQRQTKRVNRAAGSSYGLKHTAEPDIGYTTNGSFIAAAIAEGFTVQRIPGSPNAWFNISTRTSTQALQRQRMRVS